MIVYTAGLIYGRTRDNSFNDFRLKASRSAVGVKQPYGTTLIKPVWHSTMQSSRMRFKSTLNRSYCNHRTDSSMHGKRGFIYKIGR